MKLGFILFAASVTASIVSVNSYIAPRTNPLDSLPLLKRHNHNAGNDNDPSISTATDQGDVSLDQDGKVTVILNGEEVKVDPSPGSLIHPHHHGMAILDDPNLEPQQRAYWESYNDTTFFSDVVPNKGFLYAHILLNVLAWVFLAPIVVLLSVENFSLYMVLQTVQSSIAIVSLLMLSIFSTTVPRDLYPNNAYGKMSIIMFFVVIVHYLAALVKSLSNWLSKYSGDLPMDGADYVLANLRTNGSTNGRRSHDSGHAPYDDIDDEENQIDYTSGQLRDDIYHNGGNDRDSLEEDSGLVGRLSSSMNSEQTALSSGGFEHRLQDKYMARFMKKPVLQNLVFRTERMADIVYTIINRPLLFFAYIYLLTGVAVVFCVGISNEIYNTLAHYIKGSVFFLFGLVTLARYLGAFKSRGMAWNLKPGSSLDDTISKKFDRVTTIPIHLQTNRPDIFLRLCHKIPSIEFVESGLVFIYGISNIFLEHLGNRDGNWSHKDLQHASIAFMYIGGGLCGLLVEASAFNRLKDAFNGFSSDSDSTVDQIELRRQKGYSFNPFPAFIVFWTGALMSKHQQELELSTEIHSQWGTLLCVGAIFRLFTYLMLYLAAPNTTKPVKPFTELVTSFCLICGGSVFIQSSSASVNSMVYKGLDSMFTLNINVGVTALIMAWEMIVWAIKDWAAKRRVD